jgi:hypothetical protein
LGELRGRPVAERSRRGDHQTCSMKMQICKALAIAVT